MDTYGFPIGYLWISYWIPMETYLAPWAYKTGRHQLELWLRWQLQLLLNSCLQLSSVAAAGMIIIIYYAPSVGECRSHTAKTIQLSRRDPN